MADRRPPQTTRIRVRNCGALRDAGIKEPRPFTALVGPNGSGKSTLFDVFAFLSDCFTGGVRRACDRRGGLSERGRGKVADEESGGATEQELSAPDRLAVSALGQLRDHPGVVALKEFVSGWYLSSLSVDEERQPPPAGPQEHLSRSGHSPSNVLQYLQEEHPERLDTAIEQLRQAIPARGEVTYQTSPDGRLIPMMRDEPFDRPVLARCVSDGTLKMLSSPVVFSDPDIAPFIGTEEPENFLSPHLPAGLANLCRENTARSQILVTTHSTEFVDECQPAEVLALYPGEDGYTRVVRPHHIDGVNAMMDSGAKLGWLWEAGHSEELPGPRTAVQYSGSAG